jgi:hypothetical protein
MRRAVVFATYSVNLEDGPCSDPLHLYGSEPGAFICYVQRQAGTLRTATWRRELPVVTAQEIVDSVIRYAGSTVCNRLRSTKS